MDTVLEDMDEVLAGRIRHLAEARGWSVPDTLRHLLERGLQAAESEALSLDNDEARALQEALAALQDVPDDPGYALIGRIDDARG